MEIKIVLLCCIWCMLFALATAAVSDDQPQDTARPMVNLPWHIYRHFPADFSRWEASAVGFTGWDTEIRELDLGRTCLAMMHFPDTGLTAATEWGPDCPVPNALGTIEWVPRTMSVVSFRMPRLVEAARAAGLQVAHVGVGGKPYMEGEIWERCLEEVGDPPPPDTDVIEHTPAWKTLHTRDVFDLPRPNPPDAPASEFSLPEVLLPQGDDIIAQYDWQLHRLLKNRGIDHIIYTGWALNWCLWFSPCGMSDMSRKGYLCSAVRGGCVAIENKESALGEQNLEYALWKTSTMFGYVFDLHELTHALRQYAATQNRADE
ncbi:MAG: isochorismatase family protein [candidate division WS1 bacterium]|nr:isochorismatase family protein [candidate division WS1 bacterium]